MSLFKGIHFMESKQKLRFFFEMPYTMASKVYFERSG